MKKQFFGLFLGLGLLVASRGQAATDLTGTYRGHLVKDTDHRMDVIFRPLSGAVGRSGAYLGLILHAEWTFNGDTYLKRLVAYRVDPIGTFQYSMTPLAAKGDGNIAPVKRDPSLILVIKGLNKKGRNQFDIQSAGTDNKFGFDEAMTFDGCDNDVTWTSFERGDYRFLGHDDKRVLSLSAQDEYGKANASVEMQGLAGNDFILQAEMYPGIYTLKSRVNKSTGPVIADEPSRIGIFLKNGDDQFFAFYGIDGDSTLITFRHL